MSKEPKFVTFEGSYDVENIAAPTQRYGWEDEDERFINTEATKRLLNADHAPKEVAIFLEAAVNEKDVSEVAKEFKVDEATVKRIKVALGTEFLAFKRNINQEDSNMTLVVDTTTDLHALKPYMHW